MKQTTIQFSFDDGKLEAIRLYLQGKDAELDSELRDFMESLYKKNVPAQVREYIDKLDKIEIQEQPKPSRRGVGTRNAVSAEVQNGEANTRTNE